MASPQPDKFTRISNEIAEAMSRTNFTSYESRVLWHIFRITYGYNRTWAITTVSKIAQTIGLHRQHVHRTLKNLTDRLIIVTNSGYKDGTRLRFQKDYSKWKLSLNQVTSVDNSNSVDNSVDKLKDCSHESNLTRLQSEPNQVTEVSPNQVTSVTSLGYKPADLTSNYQAKHNPKDNLKDKYKDNLKDSHKSVDNSDIIYSSLSEEEPDPKLIKTPEQIRKLKSQLLAQTNIQDIQDAREMIKKLP